jgi:hypothetical protein
MTHFLFWNTNRRNIAAQVASLARELKSDVIILAECEMEPSEILLNLNSPNSVDTYFFTDTPNPESRIHIFSKNSPQFIQPVLDQPRMTIRRLQTPLHSEILLAAVHLPSRLHYSDTDLNAIAVETAHQIQETEVLSGHKKTIVVGDFNMNPFAGGMINANAFNAINCPTLASRKQRIVFSKPRHFFYNPMWRFLGSPASLPIGTYYRNPSGAESLYWHILDQVLIRPELLPHFDHSSLKIVTNDSTTSHINTTGTPSTSDHLPISFSII